MSVIARCAATPRIWELANEVTASTIVAAPTAMASTGSRSQFCRPMTSSIMNFDVAGSTRPASRLITITTRPRARRPRCFQIRLRASSQAPSLIFFFPAAAGARAVRYGRDRPNRPSAR